MRRAGAALVVGLLLSALVMPAGASADRQPRTGISWPRGQALPHFTQPRHLNVASLLSPVPSDQKVMFTTLQGVVNRERPRIYLLHTEEEGAYTWLRDLDVPWRERGRWALLRKYRDEVEGMVVWDPAVPDTINVATTLAGLKDAVAASPQLARRLSRSPHDLRVLVDLRGRFEDGMAAYRWQFNNLWPRTTHRMLVALDPEVHLGFFRDYAVANRAMVFWLEVNLPAERRLFELILNEVDPYTPYMGWFASDFAGEASGTELVSEHSSYVVASDWFANGTVFGGAWAPVSSDQPSPPKPRLRNKIYVTFTMTEGDNFQYNQHKMRVLWEDDGRGSVPLNWTTSPLLKDGAPAILSHYQRTATRNDYLLAGPSGAGYIYPTPWPDSTFPSFTSMTGRYMDATGMDSIQILNRIAHEDVYMRRGEARQLSSDVKPKGWFIHHTDHTRLDVAGGVPQATTYLVSTVEEAEEAIAESSEGWDGDSPLFLSIAPISWNMTPSDVAEVARSLGPSYRVVRGDHFFDLARAALGLRPTP